MEHPEKDGLFIRPKTISEQIYSRDLLTQDFGDTSLSIAAIIGIAAGGAVVLAITLIVIFRHVAKERDLRRKSCVEPEGVDLGNIGAKDLTKASRERHLSVRRSLAIFTRNRDSKRLSKWIDEDELHGPQLTKSNSSTSKKRISSLKGLDDRLSWPIPSSGSIPHIPIVDTSTVSFPSQNSPPWPMRMESRGELYEAEDSGSLRRHPSGSATRPLLKSPSYRQASSCSDSQLSSILEATRLREASRQAMQRQTSLLNQESGNAPKQSAPTPPFTQAATTTSLENLLDNDRESLTESVQSSVLDMFTSQDDSPSPNKHQTSEQYTVTLPQDGGKLARPPLAVLSPSDVSSPTLGSPIPRRDRSVRFVSNGSVMPPSQSSERRIPPRLDLQRSTSSNYQPFYSPRIPRTPTSPMFTSEGSPFMVDGQRREGSLLALTEIDVFKSSSPKISTGSRSQTPTFTENHSYPKRPRKATFGSTLSDSEDQPLRSITGNTQAVSSPAGKEVRSPSPKRKGYRRDPLHSTPSRADEIGESSSSIKPDDSDITLCQSPTITQLNYNQIGVAIGEPSQEPSPSPSPTTPKHEQEAYSPTMSMYNFYNERAESEPLPLPKRSARRQGGDFTEETTAVKALRLFPSPPSHAAEASIFEVSDEDRTASESCDSPRSPRNFSSPQRPDFFPPPPPPARRLHGPRDMPNSHTSVQSINQSISMLRRMNSDLSIASFSVAESAYSDASPTIPSLRGGGFNPNSNSTRHRAAKHYLAVGNVAPPRRSPIYRARDSWHLDRQDRAHPMSPTFHDENVPPVPSFDGYRR